MPRLPELLRLDEPQPDRFVGPAGPNPDHLFGGQLLAQGLLAGASSIDSELMAQSLHAVFLEAGAGDQPIDYSVERLRDGSSFATRRILGRQGGRPIVAMTASFHRPEGSPLHQAELPAWVGAPGDQPIGRYDTAQVESRDIRTAGSATMDGSPDPLELGHWARLKGPAPEDRVTTAAIVAWLSDNGPTRAARQPHLDHPNFGRIRTTSLDHHLWFHRPAMLDRWHVSILRSTTTADARGLVRGTIHDDTGRHIASLSQEVLVRLPDD